MFAANYFAVRFFAPRYFPKIGADPVVVVTIPTRFHSPYLWRRLR